MKYTPEIKIGITGLITIAVILWGINYLKGRNILESTYTLHTQYERVDGLEPSADVMLKGFKIGTVEDVIFETEAEVPFSVVMEIEKAYLLRAGSLAEIFSADLLGSKAINIVPAETGEYLEDGDQVSGQISEDMIASIMDQAEPLISSIDAAVHTLDSTAASVSRILNDPSLQQTIAHLELMSGAMRNQFSPGGDLAATLAGLRQISDTINAQSASVAGSISNIEHITSQVSNAAIDSLIFNLGQVTGNLDELTREMNTGSGSLGKLIYEDSLYRQIGQLIADLDSLVTDINENPKKYVSFSLIGK